MFSLSTSPISVNINQSHVIINQDHSVSPVGAFEGNFETASFGNWA